MRKIIVQIEETLKYQREIEFTVPDGMDDSEIEDILEESTSGDTYLGDLIYILKRKGLQNENGYDDSLDSPISTEIEVWDFRDVKKEDIA